MLLIMFRWWYTDGWKHVFLSIINRAVAVLDKFSAAILIKTLFEPWKQINSYAPKSAPLANKMQVFWDNAFARTFGFILRSWLLLLACIFAFIALVTSLLLALLWPLIPLLPVFFVIMGIQSYA